MSAGLLWGAYHFFRPGNIDAQVEHFLKVADPIDGMDLFLDHEDPKCSLEEAKEFMSKLDDKLGRNCGIYSGHLIKEQMVGLEDDDWLGEHKLWIAQYGPKAVIPTTWEKYWLWQYTGDNVGTWSPREVPGIDVLGLDINHFEGTEAELRAGWGKDL